MPRISDPITETITITPKLAAEWLKKNPCNRPLHRRTVEQYKATLARGEWKVNGETISFDITGRLLNGQHRLTAVVESGHPLRTLVVKGVESDVFSTLDNGRNRSAADVLAVVGHKHSAVMGTAARTILTMQSGRDKPTNAQIAQCVAAHPVMELWASRFASSRVARGMPGMCVGVVTLMEELHGREVADTFWAKAVEGVGVEKFDPEYHLRARINRLALGSHAKLRLVVKAANLRIEGRQLTKIQLRDTEVVRLIGLPA
jgi:hypothetical protein